MDHREKAIASLAVVLALASLYEVFAPRSALSLPFVRVPLAPELPVSAPPFVVPPASRFSDISDAPLFDAQRKKYIPPASVNKGAPPLPPNLSLVGVIIDGEKRLAMVKSSAGALASSVTVGSAVAGWQVSVIEPDRIRLKAGDSEDEIRLDANRAPPQTTSAHPRNEISVSPSSAPGGAWVSQQQQDN